MLDYSIKWTRAVKNDLRKGISYEFDKSTIVKSTYRPYVCKKLYFSPQLNEMQYLLQQVFPKGRKACTILISGAPSSKPFQVGAVEFVHSYDALEKTLSLPRYRYIDAKQVDNITDWALTRFRNHYEKGKGKPKEAITKDAIFHYVYGVLHDPVYREKYALNLRREFPHLPFYADFWPWAAWGEQLMELHVGYETVEPWPLPRVDIPDTKSRQAGLPPKAMLKADKDAGLIILDSETQLIGIPKAAWAYKLGNRSALEWILDQYKEKTPKDPTIRAKFNTYRFADYKERVIDLLLRVTRVSVATQEIVEAMKTVKR